MNVSSSPSPTVGGWKRGFWSLFLVQFQGAFSDNVFKFLVIFIIGSQVTLHQRDQYISIVLAVFSLPFILFSMTGGYLADRFSKRSVVMGTKVMEIAVMALGTLGLFLHSMPLLIVVLFLMSTHSTLFGPSKYSLLPEMLPDSRLSWGNGIVGLGTFMAIITGGILAGVLADNLDHADIWMVGLGLTALAAIGLQCSRGIKHQPPADPNKKFHFNFLTEAWTTLRVIRQDRVLFLAIGGMVYFWFLAALFGEPTILVYSQDLLHLDATQTGMLRACLAVGVAVGSAIAGIVSGKKIEYGLVPLGSLGLAVSAGLMGLPGLSAVQVGVLLAILGFSGGLYTVPLNALIQQRPDTKSKGSVIAVESWLTSVGVLVASAAFWFLKTLLHLDPKTIFLVGSVVTLCATLCAMRVVPDSLIRFMLWMLTHTLYRVRVMGRDNIPEKGGALFVCNHLSFADALFLIASTDRHIRFMLYRGIYDKWWVKPFARMMNVLPISSDSRPREMIESLQTARDWVNSGHVVCIFAEGEITRVGHMLPFRKGLTRIMKDVQAPIVPVHLDNVWGSIFSFERGHFYWKLPTSLPYPVTVSYGSHLPANAAPAEVRQAVQELGANAWIHRKKRMRTLQYGLVKTARKHPRRMSMTDATVEPIGFFAALLKALFVAGRLRPVWQGAEKVGIMLPPSVPGALVNHAALLLGKVPVNLNYTLSDEALASCIHQCGITKVISSEKFTSRLKLKLPVEVITLENALKSPTSMEKVKALLLACLCPARWMERALGAKRTAVMDDLATIIFSSGSTGEPKGVMLTQYNIISNIHQMGQIMAFQPDDRILGILPFFHSFGFTGTFGVPAVLGLGVAYHFNPTDSKVVGQLVQKHQLTFLLATPTFLQLYLRGCEPEQFGSVRFAMVGAEKLPERLATAFEERFSFRPMEAYGCTECSPAVTVNRADFRAAGLHQVGGKRGTIGHPLPGMTVRIIDPDTGAPRAVGEAGLMQLKGPNIMLGYLGAPDKTAAVLQDGWYSTGDIAAVDEDGFITITDRLSRFSKIGGEMVPHIKVEDRLHSLAETPVRTFAVTGLPDEKKGERLMVLHCLAPQDLESLMEKLAGTDLPNLWKPKRDQFIQVPQIPVLGTGKTDLRQVREIAAAAV